jgi:hypothetical protein
LNGSDILHFQLIFVRFVIAFSRKFVFLSLALHEALRSVVMEIEFDKVRTVWCPVGDFFGTGYQVREVNTWYTNVSKDGVMRSWWIMPFKNEAIVRFHNYGEETVQIKSGNIKASPWSWDRRSMHFGATWRNYTDMWTGERKTHEGTGNPYDFNYTHLKGEGVLVGDVLTLFNTTYNWWGEGDEKIYIDGEDFPSHFGTGTEDYYGYGYNPAGVELKELALGSHYIREGLNDIVVKLVKTSPKADKGMFGLDKITFLDNHKYFNHED